MDALRVIKKDGVTTYVHVSTAPVPHSITRIAKESGNYGLADQARMEHPHLVCKEGEVPGPVVPIPFGEEVVLPVGRGRGRGRNRLLSIPLVEMKHETLRNEPAMDPKNFEDVAEMFLDGIGEPETKPDVTITAPELEENDVVASMSARAEPHVVSRPRAPPEGASVPVKSSKASKTKANGYILFVRHIARQNGVTGPICTLMTQFDAQWKALPEDEKTKWKLRAKAPMAIPTRNRRESGSSFSAASTTTTGATSTMELEDPSDW